MICCQEINEYLDYYENNKRKFNKERILLIENIVKPTLDRDDVFFDEKTYKKNKSNVRLSDIRLKKLGLINAK